MEWGNPNAFFLLWLVPLGIGLALFARARRRRAAAAFLHANMRGRLLPAECGARFWLKASLGSAGLALAVLALARPRFGTYLEEVRRRGSDLVVLLDVSRSMLATDVPPSRLERAKSDVKLLLQRLKGERVGLIAFAGRAVAQCPLTTDHGFFRLALDDLDPRSAPRGGTAIGDAVRKALEMLPADAQRDQALLLITDGEDQDSFPLQAADLAAERKVAIFTVGLGDAEQGARVPGAEGKGFLSFEGKQVWSKMDPTLLQQLAMRTGGACVLAGTQAYDLGKIYDEHLAALRGEEVLGQVRRRRHERFQWFLAAALACFLAELLIKPYRPRAAAAEERGAKPKVAGRARAAAGAAALLALAACACQAGAAAGEAAPPEEPVEPAEAAKSEAPKLEPEPADRARDPYALAGEALELYGRAEYDAAARKLLAAREQLPEAAELAFDLGCARQRAGAKGEAEAHYEDASRTKDRPLALKARFNLGMLEGEEATRLAGVEPERLEPAQRGPVLEALERAIGHFRGCLNLEASYEPARKNLEMIRQWIKYHTDRWRQLDREKRRRELDLLAFLEWLAGAQESLKRGAAELAGQRLPPADAWYELKRAQGELIEEIPFVKEKIAQPQSPQAQPSAEDAERLKQAVEALTGLADQAGREMETAEAKLGAREGDPAAEAMGAAMEKLETIWDAAVPFPKLLQHDLQAQTGIVRQLEPSRLIAEGAGTPIPFRAPETGGETEKLAEAQERTRRRTALLPLKAQAMLDALKDQPEVQAPPEGQPPQPDPKDVMKGLEKAIELAPQAVERQAKALEHLKAARRLDAYPEAEEARRILEEIAKAQPRNPQDPQQDQNKQDPNKQDPQQQDQQKQDPQPQDRHNPDPQKEGSQPQAQPQGEQAPSPEQIEALLRRVREREQDRRRKLDDIRGLLAPPDAEKDW